MTIPPKNLRAMVNCSDLPNLASLVKDALWKVNVVPVASMDTADLYVGVYESTPPADVEHARQCDIPIWLLTPNHDLHEEADYFSSTEQLLEKIFQQVKAYKKSRATQAASTEIATLQPDAQLSTIPEPPESYIAHPYILTRQFFGRSAEIKLINHWAKSPDRMLIVEAIGGMGKSALTWEWALHSARTQVPDLAGMLWWSFYESNATVSNFMRHLLIYITRRSPEEIDGLHFSARLELLKRTLRARPYLLILDGFERVLTAYHRLDAPHLLDEKVDEMGQDKFLRSCTDPRHAILLKALVDCHPSKVLVSTRLMPSDLQDESGALLDGVQHHNLTGLLDDDILTMMAHYGINGDKEALIEYMGFVENHGLLTQMLAGRIAEVAAGDFDQWISASGSSIVNAQDDQSIRRSKVLEYALSGLEPESQKLLGQIAAFRYPVQHDAVAGLNPYLSPPPDRPPEVDHYERMMTHYENAIANTDNEITIATLERSKQHHFDQYGQTYTTYLEAVDQYENSTETRQARVKLHLALLDMEKRGLLSWDRFSNRFDLHPVVRSYALASLQDEDKRATYQKISQYFQGLPPEDLQNISEVSDLRRSIEIYHALINANMLEEASSLYGERLSNILVQQLGAYHLAVELLEPLFRNGFDNLPPLHRPEGRLYDLASAYYHLGRYDQATVLRLLRLEVDIDSNDANGTCSTLFNYGNVLQSQQRYAQAHRLALLELELALAIQSQHKIALAWISLLKIYRDIGQFDRAKETYRQYLSAPTFRIHWQGEADRSYAMCLHFHGFDARSIAHLALEEAAAGQSALGFRALHLLLGKIALDDKRLDDAEQYILEYIALCKKSGLTGSVKIGRGWMTKIRIAQGRPDEARQLAVMGLYNLDAAEVYCALNESAIAKDYAVEAYKYAWADGLPYVNWDQLQRAQGVLEAIGKPFPDLPPYDPVKIDPIPFEDKIRELIAKTRVERRKQRLSRDLAAVYRQTTKTGITELAGKPVKTWHIDEELHDFENISYRIELSQEEFDTGLRWTDKFAQFVASADVQHITGLVIGVWEEPWMRENADRVVQALTVAASALPHLKSIFIGDSSADENRSWIMYGDVAPLFHAYPQLEEFGIQGTNGLILGKLKHPHLKKLCIQTSGMQRDTLTAIWKADLPALEHLELWLGLRSYGATVTVEDFDQLFAGQRFPHLKYLGLRNTELTEELAEAISTAPILETLQTLDLSLGLFGDESAQRFLASKLDQGLYKLDVHHHYCSNEMMQQLQQLPLEIDLSDPKTDKVFTADFERHKLLNPAAKRHRLHSIQVHFNRLRQWLQDKMKFKHQPVHTQETNGS